MAAMFTKMLIADRGDIAVRVIQACRELGIRTVAVHSEADETSPHLRLADEYIQVGPPELACSYLNIPAIISAAEVTGADAIHPGSGALAESAYFAALCEAWRIGFVGSSLPALTLLGDGMRARNVMSDAGVPALPGSDGPVDDEVSAFSVARTIGYPVAIEAVTSAGGAWKQIVRTPSDLPEAFRRAKHAAGEAFDSGEVRIDKYLEHARHIEYQVVGDRHGNVVHLGGRECSIRHRGRTLLAESPASSLTDVTRQRIERAVVAAARSIGGTNAVTFEFLMDEEGTVYYVGANARLQAEHSVTEMVTGIDIVKEQIRVAAGEPLSIAQEDVTAAGHAIGCCIDARDPDFLEPSPGIIEAFHAVIGPGVRVDSLAHSGYTISPHYDPTIARVSVRGRDREEAAARMRRTLDMLVVEGITTSVPLHVRMLNDPDFEAGIVNASFIDRFVWMPELRELAEIA
jgi:acetyl-CoA carboxylase biotin carboxylase subunit